MARIGHWVAADAGATGTALPDRSASGATGTLTAGCTWTTIASEAAVRCPANDYVDVADHARWDFAASTFTFWVRGSLRAIGGALGLLSHSPGGGVQPKWALSFGQSADRLCLHWDGGPTVSGDAITLSINTKYVWAIRRNGAAWTFWVFDAAGTQIANGTASNSSAFADCTATLKLGYGGESFFASDIDVIAVRMDDAARTDTDVAAIAAVPDLADPGAGAALAGTATITVSATGTLTGGTAVLPVGHWIAADGYGGTTIRDRSPSGADGTLTAGCTWETIGGEQAVRCPASDYVSVPHHPRWDLPGPFTLIFRGRFNLVGTYGQPGFIAHSQGSGYVPKWMAAWGYPSGPRTGFAGGGAYAGNTWTLDSATHGLAIRCAVDAGAVPPVFTVTFFRDGAIDGVATSTTPRDVTTTAPPLTLGWGGEAFFDSTISWIVQRVYDVALPDGAVFAAMAEDALPPPPISNELAGTATITVTTTAQLLVQANLSGFATIALTASGDLTRAGADLAGAATITLTATGGLTPEPALLTGRARIVLTAAGALAYLPEMRPLRDAAIQRPVGTVETEGGTPVAGVLKFTIDCAMDTPADGWTAEVAGAALLIAPDDAATVALAIGLLNALDVPVLAQQLQDGRILERRLIGRADERRTYLRGVDALERTFRIQRAVRYAPDPPPEPLPGGVDEIETKVGDWTARTIAADLLAGTGFTLIWQVRDYRFRETFDATGSLYDLLRELVAPWDQAPPLGVDITAAGTTILVQPRTLAPPAQLTMTIAASRLVELELARGRRQPYIGQVVLEGAPEGSFFDSTPGDDPPDIPTGSELVVSYAYPVYDRLNNEVSRVEGERTYRMPDHLLIKHVAREHQKAPNGLVVHVKTETTDTTYEPSSYGPQGPLTQPLPLQATKSILTYVPAPGPPGSMALVETAREETSWKYDERRFLVATTTKRFKRATTGGVITFPEIEHILEQRTVKLDGWVELATTRTTYDPATKKTTGSVSLQTQDQAGLPPGGPRRPAAYESATFGGSVTTRPGQPGRVTAVISEDETAIPVRYSNPNLTREVLEVILAQWRAVSGIVPYHLRGTGPAIADVTKGSGLHLTEFRDADGTLIPLDPAQVRRIAFDYEDTRERAGSTCAL